MSTKTNGLLKKLDPLRTELVELAFILDSRGHFDASDVAMTTSARVGELCEELLEHPTSSFAKATADKTEDRSNTQRRISKDTNRSGDYSQGRKGRGARSNEVIV